MNGSTFKRKLPSGKVTWCFQVDLGLDEHGKRKRIFKSGFDRKADADAARTQALSELNAGEVAKPDPRKFGAFIEEWFTQHAEPNCSPKTVERYRQLAGYALPKIGHVELKKLSTLMLERLYNELRQTGGHHRKTKQARSLSAKTVRNIAGVISSALETAVRWKLLKFNPASSCVLPKLEKKEAASLEMDKLEWLLDAARSAGIFAPLTTAAATGIRRGELLALTWPDVNTAARTLTISKSLEQTKDGLRLKGPKNGKPRILRLPESLVPELHNLKAQQDVYRAHYGTDYRADLNLVFATPDGNYIKPDSFSAKVSLLTKKAGLTGASLHTLRHSHGSHLLSRGVPLPAVSKRLGHSSVYVTATVYSHALSKDEIAAADAWDDASREVSPGREKLTH